MTDTPEKKEALSALIDKCVAAGDVYVPGSYGLYDIFTMEDPLWDKYYPMNYAEAGGESYLKTVVPADPFALWNVK